MADKASRVAADEFGELATDEGVEVGQKSFLPAPIFNKREIRRWVDSRSGVIECITLYLPEAV